MIEILGHGRAQKRMRAEPGKYDLYLIKDYEDDDRSELERLARSHLTHWFNDGPFYRHDGSCTVEHLVEALAWLEKAGDDVIVSCPMGVSRSAGAGYVLRASQTRDAEAALDVFRKGLMPNIVVVEIGAEVLGMPGLPQTMEDWIYRMIGMEKDPNDDPWFRHLPRDEQ